MFESQEQYFQRLQQGYLAAIAIPMLFLLLAVGRPEVKFLDFDLSLGTEILLLVFLVLPALLGIFRYLMRRKHLKTLTGFSAKIRTAAVHLFRTWLYMGMSLMSLSVFYWQTQKPSFIIACLLLLVGLSMLSPNLRHINFLLALDSDDLDRLRGIRSWKEN
jgi:hypothetical protein